MKTIDFFERAGKHLLSAQIHEGAEAGNDAWLLTDYTIHNEETRKARKLCELYIQGIMEAQSPFWLTLLGASGVGKTHLARGIRKIVDHYEGFDRALYWKGNVVKRIRTFKTVFFRWKDIMDDYLLKEDYGILDYCANVDLLILDDLFSEKVTEFGLSNLFKLLDNRLGKWTLITSNDSFGTIREREGRIASRMDRGDNLVFTFHQTGDFALRIRNRKKDFIEHL